MSESPKTMGKESEAVLCGTEQMFKCNKSNGRPQTQIRLYRKYIYISILTSPLTSSSSSFLKVTCIIYIIYSSSD